MHHEACWGQLQLQEVHRAAVIAILPLVAWHQSTAQFLVPMAPQKPAHVLGHLITQHSAHTLTHLVAQRSAHSFVHLTA